MTLSVVYVWWTLLQMNSYVSLVMQSNESIENTKQDEQAVETVAENNANNLTENENEPTVCGSGQCSKLDEEKEAGECVRNINAEKVNEGIFGGSPDGNGQASSRNEAQMMYDTSCETTTINKNSVSERRGLAKVSSNNFLAVGKS
ncbi:conserved hypothetical protein [Trichinella spiralis]|uniref:hypothetical protein n=1 Tax=Trichinella spiralis TaxID=6334 RepID=UPI0001EFEC65|nr:conserved hypothetical protein [Trichinella spiralis]